MGMWHKATIAMACAVGMPLAAFLIVNAFDEALNPEAAALLATVPERVPASQNGYFHAVGLAAGPDELPHAAGMKFQAALNAEAEARRAGRSPGKWPDAPGAALPMQNLCSKVYPPRCIDQVAHDPDAARKVVAQHALLLEGYRALRRYPRYAESPVPGYAETPLPAPYGVLYAQRVLFVDAALRLREGRFNAVVADLEASLDFSRRMLAGTTTLVGTQFAIRHMADTALFSSEVMTVYRDRLGRGAARLEAALRPLEAAQPDMRSAMTQDFRMQVDALRECGRARYATPEGVVTGEWRIAPACLFLKQRATLNHLYLTFYKPQFGLVDAAWPEEFVLLQRQLQRTTEAGPDLTWFYNPTGRYYASGMVDWGKYVLRHRDLEAVLGMVREQAQSVARRGPRGRTLFVVQKSPFRFVPESERIEIRL